MPIEPLSTTDLLRAALVRGAASGITLAPVALVIYCSRTLLEGRSPGVAGIVSWAFTGFAFGFVAGPLASIERVAARHEPSVRRSVLTGFATFPIALVLMSLALLQIAYTWGVADGGSLESGRATLQKFLEAVLPNEGGSATVALDHVALAAAALVPVPLARLGTPSLARQSLIVGIVDASGYLPWVAANFALCGFSWRPAESNFLYFASNGFGLVILAVCLPLGARLADRVEAFRVMKDSE
jgi:hypothetical protein